MLAGEGGRGKSWLLVQLAYGIASGSPIWIDKDCMSSHENIQSALNNRPLLDIEEDAPGTIVFASWEDEPHEIKNRLEKTLRTLTNIMNDQSVVELNNFVGDRFIALNLAGEGPVWGPWSEGSGHMSTKGELTRLGEKIRQLCSDRKAKLLIIDPLAAAYGLDENSRSLVRAFISSWDAWAQQNDCAVILVHHEPKNKQAYSGSTDWHAGARAFFSMKTDETDTECTVLEVLKTNYGRIPPPLYLERDTRGCWCVRPKPEKEETKSKKENNNVQVGKKQSSKRKTTENTIMPDESDLEWIEEEEGNYDL